MVQMAIEIPTLSFLHLIHPSRDIENPYDLLTIVVANWSFRTKMLGLAWDTVNLRMYVRVDFYCGCWRRISRHVTSLFFL